MMSADTLTPLREHIRGKTLESMSLRASEAAHQNHAGRIRMHNRLVAAGISDKKIEKLLVRAFAVRKPTKDQRILAQLPPEWAHDHDALSEALHHKRTVELRRIMRIHHLAYGFLKGVPYRAMEQKSYTPPPFLARRDVETAGKYGELVTVSKLLPTAPEDDPVRAVIMQHAPDVRVTEQRYAAWLADAGDWRHPQFPHMRNA